MTSLDTTLILATAGFIISGVFIYFKIFKNKKFQENSNVALSVIILGFAIVIFFPIIFSRTKLINTLDFSQSGNIGDTIGGITAPFVGLISAVLVYFSFRAQIDANEELKRQILGQERIRVQNENYEEFKDILKSIENKLENFEAFDCNFQAILDEIGDYQPERRKGLDAIKVMIEILSFSQKEGNLGQREIKMIAYNQDNFHKFKSIRNLLLSITEDIATIHFEDHKKKLVSYRLNTFIEEYFPVEDELTGLRILKPDDCKRVDVDFLEWWANIRLLQCQLENLDLKDYPYSKDLISAYSKNYDSKLSEKLRKAFSKKKD